MELHIDKSNVESLIRSGSHSLFNDTIKLIKNQLDVFLNFKKSEILENEALLTFFKLCTSGVGNSLMEFKEESPFPTRPLKESSANHFSKNQLTSILLLDDPNTDKLKNAGAILVGGVGEEMDILIQTYLNQNDYLFDRELRIGGPEFQSWDDLKNYSTPLTDLIVIDPFIFKNSEIEEETLDVNLIKWLSVLCIKARNKVNIVIVYKPSEVTYELPLVKVKICDAVGKIIGKKPLVTFIRTYKEHDRTIITNYLRISGNTFNYWNVNGRKITNGKQIDIKSLARREYHYNALQAIADIQDIIDCDPTGSNVTGDKYSNFLTFK